MANNDRYNVALAYIGEDDELHVMICREPLWYRTAKREMQRWSPRVHRIEGPPYMVRVRRVKP